MICPCCGSDIGQERLKSVLTPTENAIIKMLTDRRGGAMSMDEISDKLYGERGDGGPDTSSQVIRVIVSRIRRKLGPVIENTYGGYRLRSPS